MLGENWLRELLIEQDLRRLRRLQADRALPLVSQILEGWDQVPLDAKQQIVALVPGIAGSIMGLESAMEDLK